MGVIVPHGVLFRAGAEGRIRQELIGANLLDAVIGLPSNLFFGTGIPAAILLFDRSRERGGANETRRDVLFIDASREFQAGKNQNALADQNIARIAAVYHAREEIAQYSRRVAVEDITGHDFNLNVPRYIDTFEAKEETDLGALQAEITELERQLADVRRELARHLQALEGVSGSRQALLDN